MIRHKCEYCGKEKEYKYPSHVKKYCSHQCANKALLEKRDKGEMVDVSCKTCGKVFSMLQSEKKRREAYGGNVQYCSKKCMGVGMRTRKETTCKNCGKSFETTRLNERGKGQYCSRKCAGEFRRKTGFAKKNGYWMENGYKVIYLEGNKSIKEHIKVVQDCLGRELNSNECVHHINGNKEDNRIENLQLMTKGEHSKLHREQEKAGGQNLFGRHIKK